MSPIDALRLMQTGSISWGFYLRLLGYSEEQRDIIGMETCGCVPESGSRPRATCWYCYHGQHDKCTANQHGNRSASCPRMDQPRCAS